MPTETITRERIDELLAYLPSFSAPGAAHQAIWRGGERDPQTGTISMPYATYLPEVEAFFGLVRQSWWLDYAYQPSIAAELIASDAAIAAASLAQIKMLLTYCVRGERFSDGHWAAMIQSGRIAAILRRLAQLRNQADR